MKPLIIVSVVMSFRKVANVQTRFYSIQVKSLTIPHKKELNTMIIFGLIEAVQHLGLLLSGRATFSRPQNITMSLLFYSGYKLIHVSMAWKIITGKTAIIKVGVSSLGTKKVGVSGCKTMAQLNKHYE